MSENLIMCWADSLDAAGRARLRVQILGRDGSPSAALLAAYAAAMELTESELSGLLPDVLPQARVAASRLLAGHGPRPSILAAGS
jgi:hypothetical protein